MKQFSGVSVEPSGQTDFTAACADLLGVDHGLGKTSHLIAKRCLDIFVSFSAIVTLFPFFVLICALICLESRGAPIFSQIRWGRNGTKIRIYKFRSMRTDMCDASGVKQTTDQDMRVTRMGRVLRKTSIDELPQLFNVLLGDMSLVGPRCHVVGMMAAGKPYEDLIPTYHRRHLMRPGITGLAQVRGWRGPTVQSSKARARVACDLYYLENFSFWLDLKIIASTVMSEIRGGTGS